MDRIRKPHVANPRIARLPRWRIHAALIIALSLGASVALFAEPFVAKEVPQDPQDSSKTVEEKSESTDKDPKPAPEKPAPDEKPTPEAKPVPDAKPQATAGKPEVAELPWITTLEAGLEDARQKRRPVLVDVGAEWCGWCKKLDIEIRKPEVQTALAKWTLVRLDSDKDPETARKLAVGPIPAMRILSAQGRTISAHDGYFSGDDLTKWLDRFYKGATAASELLGAEPKDEGEAEALLIHLTAPDPVAREAATRRLLRRPDLAAAKAVEAFSSGKLAARLAILELLREWKAPLEGVDPWEPQTLTPQRLQTLKKWSTEVKSDATTKPSGANTLSPADLTAARRDLTQMLQAETGAEVRAARERLARNGKALLPEVHAAMKAAATDRDRERLTALRYRVAASDALAVDWSEGFDSLASPDGAVRHRAVDELQARAKPEDGALLLELFADPDPLVRETSLRALQALGDQGVTLGVVKLLQDPEPNVRAAVLKQLAETPVKGMEAEVVKFVLAEKDPDLVVHGVRVLRGVKGKAASKALLTLLSHDSWRVRAEAAEALGKSVDESHGGTRAPDEQKADIYAAMIKLLDDPDGFVVSRAVIVLRDSSYTAATEPLVEAADKRPELAPDVVRALTHSGNTSTKHLRKFAAHKSPVVRAAAIQGLISSDAANVTKEIITALSEDESTVRTAAAAALVSNLERMRANPEEDDYSGSSVFSSGSKKKTIDMEKWLTSFRAAGGHPEWLDELAAPLEAMVAGKKPGSTPEEAATAAVVLTAIGRDATGTAVVQKAAKADAAQRRAVADALAWLPWETRLSVFKDLTVNPGRDELGGYVRQMSEMPNAALAEVMWDILKSPAADPALAYTVHDSIQRTYLGKRYYDKTSITDKKLQPMVDVALGKLKDGTEMQQLAALSLLVEYSSKDVIEPAEKLYKERPATDRLKTDAFQILLLAKHQRAPADAAADARAVLAAGGDATYEAKKIAVRYLCLGTPALTSLRDAISLNVSGDSTVNYGRGGTQTINVEVPEGLSIEIVRPMLSDSDKHNAAYAGYLACLLGDRAGLEPLVGYWRTTQRESEVRKLVYRAVSVINDDTLTPILAEVYTSMSTDSYEAREFYWTIRSIKGPNILKLRKKIRDEVGMEQLR